MQKCKIKMEIQTHTINNYKKCWRTTQLSKQLRRGCGAWRLAMPLNSVVGEEDCDHGVHGVHGDGVDSNRAQLMTKKSLTSAQMPFRGAFAWLRYYCRKKCQRGSCRFVGSRALCDLPNCWSLYECAHTFGWRKGATENRAVRNLTRNE